MQAVHDRRPDLNRGVRTQIRQAVGRVKADPADADIIRRVSGKPAILVVRRGTGLACDIDALNLSQLSGAVFDRIGQHVVHIIRGCLAALKYLFAFVVLSVENDVSVGIQHLGVAPRLGELSIVCQRRIALCKLTDGDALRQTAERKLCVSDIVLFVQRLKLQLLGQELIRGLRREHLEHLNRHRVGGLCHAVHDRSLTGIGPVFVFRPRLALVLKDRHIRCRRVRCNQPCVNCRCIGAQRLHRGARTAGCLCCAVEHETLCFLAASADDAQHVAVLRIEHDHCGLERNTVVIIDIREVCIVFIDIFQRLLHLKIHGGVNLQTAVGNQTLRIFLRESLFALKISDNITNDSIRKVRIDRAFLALLAAALVGELLIDRFFVLTFGNITLLVHLCENRFLTFLCGFGMLVRIVRRRILRQSGDHRTLCKIQLADVDTEIGSRRRLNAVGVFSEVNDIHIQLKDRILVQLLLQRERTNHLRQLSLDRVIVI